MTISWLQDMDIMSAGGGAQLTDRAHFLEGIRRGHDLELITPQSQVNALPTPVIISNASLFPLELFQDLQRSGKPYIFFCHDYFPICKYRLYYPMVDGYCQSCYLKERWLPILAGARLIIWLSPLHRESWLWLYPELASAPYHLAPSPVDPDRFKDLGLERQGVVAVASLAVFKGKRHVLKWATEHPQVRVDFVSDSNGGLPANCQVLGWVPYSDMNRVYNRHEALLHLPQSPSPFDRTVAEAYLAGCRIIGNSLVGALSYPWFTSREAVAEHCRNSPREFWEAVERALS